jgi:nicotinate-nucleotide adenylyltransferase
MKIAVLGGSFNPVHLGHLFLADEVLCGLGYDRLILVPAFESPFKPGIRGASAVDRLDMLAASIPGESRITVDDTEIRRKGISYTIDTILDILERYRPEGKPGLVLGDDLVRDFPRWKQAGDIANLADIIIARRHSAEPLPFPYPCRFLNNEIMMISSGMVRTRIQRGEGWRYLVSEGARIIIEDRRLYGLSPAASAVPSLALLVFLEKTVQSMVNASRFIHSRNTALLARDLCCRFGLDPAAGYLAGIAHDMGKSLSDEELMTLAERDGMPVSVPERRNPNSLLHGRAAAVLLRERFAIHNEDILEAIRFHTTGAELMSPLAKILFVADKTEVSRKTNARFRELYSAGLDTLFRAVFEDAVRYLRSRKVELSESTLRLLNAMAKGDP